MILLWLLIAIWAATLWWMLGACLLYLCGCLPSDTHQQLRATLLWPFTLLGFWSSTAHPINRP